MYKIFLEICDFAEFLVENFIYLRTGLTDFSSKARFRNPKLYFKKCNKNTWS
jgi:hypothetical protein